MKHKNLLKRATAWLVVMAMIISIMPVGIVSAGGYDYWFNLRACPYFMALSPGDTTTLAGHNYLGRTGATDITVVERYGVNFLHLTNRTADWHGIDIPVYGNLSVGDVIRVTGRVEGNAPGGANMRFAHGQNPWTALHNVPAPSGSFNHEFTLLHTVTQAQYDRFIPPPQGNAVVNPGDIVTFRIQTDNPGATMNFFIYNIEIGQVLPERATVPPVPGDPPPPLPETLLYNMAEDVHIQSLVHGTTGVAAIFANTPYLDHPGGPTYTIVPHPSGVGNSIHLDNRNQNFYAVDIVAGALDFTLGATYRITATGRAPSGTGIQLGQTDAGWGQLSGVTTPATGVWSVTHTLTQPQLRDFFTGSQRGIRIMTSGNAGTIPFYIDDIVVVRIGDRGDDELVLPGWDLAAQSLHQAFEEYFLFGNIWSTQARMNSYNTMDGFLHHFNSATAENSHKVDTIAVNPNPDLWSFGTADLIVDWAEDNDLAMVGHTLVWHSQSPAWLTTIPGTINPRTRAEAIENMHRYISTVAGRYAGRMYSWDVLNEIVWGVPTSNWSGNWRNYIRGAGTPPAGTTTFRGLNLTNQSAWYNAFANGAVGNECGTDFIYYAFKFARMYDPFAILYYNDYNDHVPGKRDAIAQMIIDINTRWANDSVNNPAYGDPTHRDYGRLLIEGMGMQSHYSITGWMSEVHHVRDALQLYISTGVRVSITELDVTIGGSSGSPATPTPALLERQAERYRELFEIYLAHHENVARVTIWGLADHQSWIGWGFPVLFDENFRTKPAFYGVLEALENAPPSQMSQPVITTLGLPDGEVDEHFAYQVRATQNTHAPTLWTVVAGELPPGLRLVSTTGVILGAPTECGIFTFSVAATNARFSGVKALTLMIFCEDCYEDENPCGYSCDCDLPNCPECNPPLTQEAADSLLDAAQEAVETLIAGMLTEYGEFATFVTVPGLIAAIDNVLAAYAPVTRINNLAIILPHTMVGNVTLTIPETNLAPSVAADNRVIPVNIRISDNAIVTIDSPLMLTLEAGMGGTHQLTATATQSAIMVFSVYNAPEGVTVNSYNQLVVPDTLPVGTYNFLMSVSYEGVVKDSRLFILMIREFVTVTIVLNGGTFYHAGDTFFTRIPQGSSFVVVPIPTKPGFSFNGWFVNGVPFDENTVINTDITLVAMWTPITIQQPPQQPPILPPQPPIIPPSVPQAPPTAPAGTPWAPRTTGQQPPVVEDGYDYEADYTDDYEVGYTEDDAYDYEEDYVEDYEPAEEDYEEVIPAQPTLNTLIFTAGSVEYQLNGVGRTGVGAPFIDTATDRMMIPLRTLAGALGVEVDWDSATRSAIVFLPTGVLVIPADEMLPEGMGSAMIIEDRIFIPLRFVMYAFDAVVEWDSANRAAVITF